MKSQAMKSIVASFLFVMLLGGALQASQVKVDQSSKEAVVETFLLAAAYGDADGYWQIMTPELREELLSGAFGNEEKAKKTILEAGTAGLGEQTMTLIKVLALDSNKLKVLVKKYVKTFEPGLVRINGKWYLDLFRIATSTATAQEVAALKKPERIDHSTPESLAEGYMLALVFKDADLLWEVFSPAIRSLMGTNGVAQGKQQLLETSLSGFPPQHLNLMRSALAGRGKQGALAGAVRGMRSQGMLTQIDGKWYLQDPDLAK